MKLSKTAEDIAKVNVAVMVTLADGKFEDARIALGSVAPTPIRATKAEEAIKGQEMNEKSIAEASAAAAEAATPISDIRSTADYRKEMVRILVKDALQEAAERAQA
jgi:carbon-monoxide dehydrogenase medium subunit